MVLHPIALLPYPINLEIRRRRVQYVDQPLTTGTAMSLPLRATIETTVQNIPEAILEAGFRPGHQLRIQVEYVDDDEDTPPGFVLIESDGKRMLSGVTLEILPQALKKLGIGPDETFSIIVRRDADSSGGTEPDDGKT